MRGASVSARVCCAARIYICLGQRQPKSPSGPLTSLVMDGWLALQHQEQISSHWVAFMFHQTDVLTPKSAVTVLLGYLAVPAFDVVHGLNSWAGLPMASALAACTVWKVGCCIGCCILQPLRRDWREKLDEIRLELPGYSQCSGNWVYSTIWGSSLSHRYYREASRAQGISQLSYLGWVQLNYEGRDQSAQGRGQ